MTGGRRDRGGGRRARLVLVALLATVPATWAGATGDAARGWRHLVDRLAADGIERERALAIFTDPRVERFDGLGFALVPRESRALYRGFLLSASVSRARRCFQRHEGTLRAVERTQGVGANVVAAILHVESNCGANTGSEPILPRLARLAMANEPANVLANLQRHGRLFRGPRDELERLTERRARYLEDTFYPEVRGVFEIADRLALDPLILRGSSAGAFGIPQFLPTSYLRHGTDGNGDGRVSLYDPDDAIASCAAYLAANGWKRGLSTAERRRVIWSYNRSTPYVDTVLALAARLPSSPSAR